MLHNFKKQFLSKIQRQALHSNYFLLIQNSINILRRIFIVSLYSSLDEKIFAGSTFVIIFVTIFSIPYVFFQSIAILINRAKQTKRMSEVYPIFSRSLLISFVFGAVFSLISYNCFHILHLFRVPAELVITLDQFMKVYCWCCPFQMLLFVFQNFLFSCKKFLAVIVSNFFVSSFMILLIKGLYKSNFYNISPNVFIAWGYVFYFFILCIVTLIPTLKCLNLYLPRQSSKNLLKTSLTLRIFKSGFPMMLNNSILTVIRFFNLLIISKIGIHSLAINQHITPLFLGTLIISLSCYQSTALCTSNYYPFSIQKYNREIKKILWTAFLVYLLLCLVLGPSLIHKISPYVFVLCLVNFALMFLKNIDSGKINGTESFKHPLFINLACSLFVGLPLSYGLGLYSSLKLIGVYLGTLSSNVLSILLMRMKWRKIHREIGGVNAVKAV